MVKKL